MKNKLIIDVLNNGKKISKQDQNSLFEPFFTTHSSGTGLGLYVAKELTELNYAQLDFIAEKELTCFQIKISLEK